MKFYALFCCLFIVLFVSPNVLAGDVEINITEVGKTISYYGEYYVVNVNGTISFTNPANESLYDLVIPLALSPLTITVEKPYASGRTILETHLIRQLGLDPGVDSEITYRIYSKSIGTLMKAIPEQPGVPNSNRLISVVLRNPTSLQYDIEFVKVIKTSGMQPSYNVSNGFLDSWEFPSVTLFGGRFNQNQLSAYEEYTIDFIDTNSTEGEIYWLNTNYYIPNVSLSGTDLTSHYTEEDIELIVLNETNVTTFVIENQTFMEFPIFLRKTVSDTILFPGDLVNVELNLYNFEPSSKSVVLKDYIPSGFKILTEGLNGTEFTWDMKLSPNSIEKIIYDLEYYDEDSIGLDYFKSAEVSVDERTFYSRSIPFVRKFVPEKILFVQKKLKYITGDEIEVTLELRNMGESSVKNIVLREFLKSKNTFREITQQPDRKGTWKIDSIQSGETWTVTYITNEHENINLFPEIYGVESSYVMKSMLLESIIHSKFKLSSVNAMEIIGLAMLVLVPLIYFIFSRSSTNETKLKLMEYDKKIAQLKKVSSSDNQRKINDLKSDTKQYSSFSPKKYDRTYTPDPKIAVNKDHMKDVEENSARIKEVEKESKS